MMTIIELGGDGHALVLTLSTVNTETQQLDDDLPHRCAVHLYDDNDERCL